MVQQLIVNISDIAKNVPNFLFSGPLSHCFAHIIMFLGLNDCSRT